MAAQLREHGRAMLLFPVGVICAGSDGVGWDGMGWDGIGAGMSSPINCTGLARFILDGRMSLFCWLVRILLPFKHIII